MNDISERQDQLREIVTDMLAEATRQGASSAEAGANMDNGLSVAVRMGEVETIEHTRDQGVGISVYFGQRKGTASTSDFKPEAIRDAVRAACNIARYTAEDSCTGLADAGRMAREIPDLDLYHPWAISVEQAIESGIACETAARELDPRITNSEGASLNSHTGIQVYGNSHGFLGGYPSSHHSLSCAVVGQQGDSMQRDYWYTSARNAEALESAIEVGRRAGERTLARLGARQIKTCDAPVIFQAEVAVSLLRSLVGAISGSSLYRRSSFLLDRLGERIFPDFVRISEDPLLPRGNASAPFDSEGVATAPKDLVSDGILRSYLLGSYSARRLGMESTANAGGVRNLSIDSGELSLDELLQQMGSGLLVSELMGSGVNMVTGDYSRGAAGFWVEHGEIQYPVEEITIAGNLGQMFAGLQAVGSDIERRGSTRTGSWLLSPMTIAGS
ncbi:MAG: metalloprotease PmbA [Gammaproteobacteria bacterium]|nr:metalloprotease PmbA [Gammaproteobacteria bacterium]